MSEGILLGLALRMPLRSSLMICCTSDEPRRLVEPACELSESMVGCDYAWLRSFVKCRRVMVVGEHVWRASNHKLSRFKDRVRSFELQCTKRLFKPALSVYSRIG